jgi:hypothetical protein
MPIHCTFTLNKKSVSTLSCSGVGEFAAFSGNDGAAKNNAEYASMKDVGPLPPGRYYIVDRGSGGLYTHLRDAVLDTINRTDKITWFALYRDDGSVDDETFINGVRRGNFRLHPHGLMNVSDGCITLVDVTAFNRLRKSLLLGTVRIPVPSGKGFAYGTVEVKE